MMPTQVYLHRAIKRMTPEFVNELKRRFDWIKRPGSFERALAMSPRDAATKFYKLMFIRRHAFNRIPTNLTANKRFGQYTNPKKFLKAAERLKNVSILYQDYQKTIQQFDRPSTFFFIDPPYPGEWFEPANAIDLDTFVGVLSRIRGKFISVINQTPGNFRSFKKLGRVFRMRVQEVSGQNGTRKSMVGRQPGGSKLGMRLFVANFPMRESHGLYVKQVA